MFLIKLKVKSLNEEDRWDLANYIKSLQHKLTSHQALRAKLVDVELPEDPAEYLEYASKIDSMSDEIYRYMNFDQIASFQKGADEGKLIAAEQIVDVA